MRTFFIAMLTSAAFIIWGLFMGGPAKADRIDVCGYLDRDASVASIEQYIVDSIETDGADPKLVASKLVDDIIYVCPEHGEQLTQFIAKWREYMIHVA